MLVGPARQGTSEVIEVRDPGDGSLVGAVPRASVRDVEAVLDHAAEGARVARALAAHERMSILRAAADQVQSRHEEFARTIAREGIKTIREARAEVTRCVDTLQLSAEEARRLAGETLAFDQRPGSENKVGYWIREPIGIVLAITPFNDPLNLVAHKVGPAIASGNAVIVKPHSETPLSALLLGEAFVAAGLPPKVLQVVTGRGSEIGDRLIADPRVNMVSFTGGPAIGDHVVQVAGRKKIALELGANSPAIVLPDADLDAAAAAIVGGGYYAAGQNCLHVQRVIADREIAGPLRDRMLGLVQDLRTGDKLDERTDLGPVITDQAAARITATVREAIAAGGRLLAGGGCDGRYIEPTLVDHLPRASRLAREEIFGPVVGIIESGSLDHAIEIANEVDQALHACVFTQNIGAAMRVVREVAAGAVIVNDSTDYRIDAMPFGGVKGSGLGREGVPFTARAMTTTKVVCLNL